MKLFIAAGIGLSLAASGWGPVYPLSSQPAGSGTANIAPSSILAEPSMITPTRTGEAGRDDERFRRAHRKPPAREDTDRRAQQRIELLEDTLRTEHADPDWSAQAAQGIADALRSGRALGIATSSVACRSTLCRVELAYDNPQAFVQFQHAFLTQVSDVLPDALIEQKDGGNGRTNTVIYLARQAYELPALAEGQ